MFESVLSHMHKAWDAVSDGMRMPLGGAESLGSEMKRQREAAVGRIEQLTDDWASATKQSVALGVSLLDSCQTMWTDWLARAGRSGKPS